jgi:predicted NUDIX family phosphoesterase
LTWIDFENLSESAKEIDRVLELEDSKIKQIDSFMAFLNDNTWTDLANIAIGGFTKTLVAVSAIEIREQDSFRTRLRSQIVRIPWARRAYRRLLAVKNAF